MIWRSDEHQMCDFFNLPWLQFTGRTLAEEAGTGWTDGIHQDDRAQALDAFARAFGRKEPFRLEYRLRRADGAYRWIIDTGVPRYSPRGEFSGYVGSCLDITERKQAEEGIRANEAALRSSHEQIQDLAGRLISAQETERARIGRELHDDVSQELAAIAINISGIKRRPEARREAGLLDALSTLQQRTAQVTEGIRRISHDLHPSVLEHSGLVDALRAHCQDCARQYGLKVAFYADGTIGTIHRPAALCLYRVAQEALHNVVKHAGARSVDVWLTRSDDTVALTIGDDGRGFDVVSAVHGGTGLGLQSIEERVRLAGGRVNIVSGPSRGTRLTAELTHILEGARAESA
jgi:PAS domain S-box-containing protein